MVESVSLELWRPCFSPATLRTSPLRIDQERAGGPATPQRTAPLTGVLHTQDSAHARPSDVGTRGALAEQHAGTHPHDAAAAERSRILLYLLLVSMYAAFRRAVRNAPAGAAAVAASAAALCTPAHNTPSEPTVAVARVNALEPATPEGARLHLTGAQVLMRHGARTPCHHYHTIDIASGWDSPPALLEGTPPADVRHARVSKAGAARGCGARQATRE
jgi:hypothetical protein